MAKNMNAPLAKSEDRVRTPKGVLIYPWLFKKDAMQDKYCAILAVDPDEPSLAEFKKTVRNFGTQAFDGKFPKDLSWCIRDGDAWLEAKDKPPVGAVAAAAKGKVLIVMKSEHAPLVSFPQGGKFVTVENAEDEKQVYQGCLAAAQGVLAAFNGKYPAVVFWFSQVAKVGKGEKIGGADPQKTFGDMYDADDDSVGAGAASTADMDDEIPF